MLPRANGPNLPFPAAVAQVLPRANGPNLPIPAAVTCVRFSPHAFYLEEKVEVFAAEALRNPEVNTLQFGSPLQ